MNKMMKALVGTGSALGVLGIVCGVRAADVKIIPGSACLPQAELAPNFSVAPAGLLRTFTQIFLPVFGGDPASFPKFNVVCPLVRDQTATNNGLADLDVYTLGGGVTCTAVSLSNNGNTLRSINGPAPIVGPNTPNGGVSRIDFGAMLGGSGASEVSSGTTFVGSQYGVICVLPNGTGIQSIRYDEN